ncbi:MAG: SPFH domain-containing protein [Streptosporangiaceae bacterium]
MASQVLGAASNQPSAGQPVTERPARFQPGVRIAVLCSILLLAGVALAVQAAHDHGGAATAVAVLCGLCFIAASVALRGLTAVAPGQARVVQLFGKYRGTIREPGLQWVNPFTERIKVSTRIRNQESALRRALADTGRLPGHTGQTRPRGRPRASSPPPTT